MRGAWLAPGAHVTAIGNRPELDDEVFLRAQLVVTTSKIQELNVHALTDEWPLVHLTRAGLLDWDSVVEFGEVVSGPLSPTEGITVFSDAYGGFGDLALASWVYERAVELGRGTEWLPG